MVQRNPYEHLRHQENIWPCTAQHYEHVKVADFSPEHIDMYTAEIDPGKFSYGYMIGFKDGRQASKMPGDLSGWFSSRKDAELYFLGYIIRYKEYFSDEAIRAVKKLIVERIQINLFQQS